MPSDTSLFRPSDGWFNDVMPIYVDGVFHLFYPFLNKNDKGAPGVLKGLDLGHVTTRDFVTFEEQPLALHRGGLDEADPLIGAGSVVRDGSGYIVYYCGLSPRGQVVLRAKSPDLYSWTKDATFVLEADAQRYDHDWRDPEVYRDGDRWQMLICTRVPEGPHDRRGAIGRAMSEDLLNWEIQEPLLVPGTTYAPECPQIFDHAGRRYLLYSTYSDRFATRYRIGSTSSEEWTRPLQDELDSHNVYAMKTIGDGAHRYLIGWLSTRAGDKDSGHRQIAGDLVVHELVPRQDATLGVRPLASVLAQFDEHAVTFEPRMGDWSVTQDSAEFGGAGFGWCSLGEVGDRCTLRVDVDLGSDAEEFGIAVRATEDFRSAYLIRFEPERHRVVFDRRPHRIDEPFDYESDRSYVNAMDHEIERPLTVADGWVSCHVIVDGSAIMIYIGDVALTTRGYNLDGGELGVYAANGKAQFLHPIVGRLDRGRAAGGA
jgi:beta-fructofuranosidase